jgi:hypothetical protein
MVGELETISFGGPISWLTTLVHLVDIFTVLSTFSSFDMVLCPELAIFMKELAGNLICSSFWRTKVVHKN